MKYVCIHIVLLFLIIPVEVGFSQQRSDGRGSYIPHHERIEQLRSELQNVRGGNRDKILLELADQYYNQAKLHTLLWQSLAAIGTVYYDIIEDGGTDRGVASDLYRGINYFELGRYSEAQKALGSFLNTGGSVPDTLKIKGEAWSGAVEFVSGNEQKAIDRWRGSSEKARTPCSVLSYVQARVGYDLHALHDRCLTEENRENADRKTILQVLISTGRFDDVPEIIRNAAIDFSFTENEATNGGIRHFDPSEIVTFANAHFASAAHYARQAGHSQKERFYKGALYFYSGQYKNVIDVLIGVDDLQSALYLAGAYYRTGEQKMALEIFDYIERAGGEDVVSNLNILYAMLGVDGRKDRADRIFQNKINGQPAGSRQNVPQDIYKQLGLVYFYTGEYEKVLAVLGTAFRSERRSDLRVNEPGFMILYGASVVLAKNFISLSDAIDMFSTVMRAYPSAEALVEITSLIDVATNIGREGRIIYRR